MNYFELVNDYHSRGINHITAIPLYDVGQSTDFVTATGPGDFAAGKHGWVRATYTTTANSRTVRVPHALLRSAYSGNVIDLKNGVWNNGNYTGQPVKVIFLPTLNNHGSFGSEDYAGPTSALKCHLGIVEFAGPGVSLHDVGYSNPISPQAMGESVGHLITQVLQPAFYLTVAEYTGYRGRTTATAANTKTVGSVRRSGDAGLLDVQVRHVSLRHQPDLHESRQRQSLAPSLDRLPGQRRRHDR